MIKIAIIINHSINIYDHLKLKTAKNNLIIITKLIFFIMLFSFLKINKSILLVIFILLSITGALLVNPKNKINIHQYGRQVI